MKRTSDTIWIALVSRKVSYTLIVFSRPRVKSPVFKGCLVWIFVNNEHGSITDSSCAPNMYHVKSFSQSICESSCNLLPFCGLRDHPNNGYKAICGFVLFQRVIQLLLFKYCVVFLSLPGSSANHTVPILLNACVTWSSTIGWCENSKGETLHFGILVFPKKGRLW